MKHEVMLNHENKGKLNTKQSTVWLTVHRRKKVCCDGFKLNLNLDRDSLKELKHVFVRS